MKNLRVVQMKEETIEEMSWSITKLIDKLKDNIFFEGAFYICGGTKSLPLIIMGIVYNDYKFDFDGISNKERDEFIATNGIDLRTETIGSRKFTSENRKIERSDYPFEFQLRYGTILYDKNGKLAKIKELLENDPEIEAYLGYWQDACQFEPAIKYKRIPNFKEINDLVRDKYGIADEFILPTTFNYLRTCYNDLTKQIEDLLEKKKPYDELLKIEYDESDRDEFGNKPLSFKRKLEMYNTTKAEFRYALLDVIPGGPELKDYLKLCDDLRDIRRARSDILSENISFDNFGGDIDVDGKCFNKHCLVKLDDELVCVRCGATTKDYGLNKEELEFLTLCAESQGLLVKEFTKEDMDLLKVLMAENDYYISQRTPINEIEEDGIMGHMDWAEEYYLEDEMEISEYRRKIRKAQILDGKLYLDKTGLSEEDAKKSYLELVREGKIKDVGVADPWYLKGKKLEELQKQLDEKWETAKPTNVSTENYEEKLKSVLDCYTMRYELAILTGASIPDLVKEVKTEDEMNALTQAYINMSSQEGRVKSGYFENENEAVWYDCITASPEINQRILQMKMKK